MYHKLLEQFVAPPPHFLRKIILALASGDYTDTMRRVEVTLCALGESTMKKDPDWDLGRISEYAAMFRVRRIKCFICT